MPHHSSLRLPCDGSPLSLAPSLATFAAPDAIPGRAALRCGPHPGGGLPARGPGLGSPTPQARGQGDAGTLRPAPPGGPVRSHGHLHRSHLSASRRCRADGLCKLSSRSVCVCVQAEDEHIWNHRTASSMQPSRSRARCTRRRSGSFGASVCGSSAALVSPPLLPPLSFSFCSRLVLLHFTVQQYPPGCLLRCLCFVPRRSCPGSQGKQSLGTQAGLPRPVSFLFPSCTLNVMIVVHAPSRAMFLSWLFL